MSSMQQCVTRHDSVLSAATNDNSAVAPARRHVQVSPAQMSRPTESDSCDMARQLHNIRMIETPQAAPPSTQTSASVRQQPAPQSLTAPRTHGPATTQLADGQLWSDLPSAVATDPPTDGFQIPRYHRKKAAAVKAAPPKAIDQTKKRRQVDVYYGNNKSDAFKGAPRKLELFVFNVEKETDMTALKDFMQEEHVKVLEMECVSHIDSWTKSFRVLLTADDPKCTLDADFWPVGVECRLYFKKRRQTAVNY